MIRNGMIRTSAVIGAFALLALAALVSGCGKSAGSLYLEGKTLLGKPETVQKGVAAFEQFAKRFPKDPRAPEVLLTIATVQQSEKRFPEAESIYLRLVKTYPGTPEAYKGQFLLGYLYYDDMKNTDKAKATLNAFIAAYPDSNLTVSAKVLLENIGIPVDQWTTVKKITSEQEPAPAPVKGAKKR
jgi:TolA-binding protein